MADRLTRCAASRTLAVFVIVCLWVNGAQAQDQGYSTAFPEVEQWPFSMPHHPIEEQPRNQSSRANDFRPRLLPGHSDVSVAASASPIGEGEASGWRPIGGQTRPGGSLALPELRLPAEIGHVPEQRYPEFHADAVVEHIPAPDDDFYEPLSLKSDLSRALFRLRDDSLAVYRPDNLLHLGVAGGATFAIRDQWDDEVRHDAAMHPERWGVGSDILGVIGAAEYQVPVILGIYALSLQRQDHELHDFSATMTSAFTINGLSTLLLKGITDTERPSADFNGGRWGFPSYHASSSFAIAGVLDEYYGHRVGFPAYLTAGLIGWSRIDELDHDLSDVVFGSALGYVIGKSVARHELTGDSRVRLVPWIPPLGGSGLSVQVRY